MNRVFKKLILSSSVALCALGTATMPVMAYDDEYETFSQVDSRWSGYSYDGGYTIGNAGCLITSISTLMAYANDDLQDVNVWNPKIASQYFSFDGNGSFYWDSTVNADPTFKFVGKLSGYNAKETIKSELEKGNYIVIHSSNIGPMGHYSPIVGLDDNGNPEVWDVGGDIYSDFNEWVSAGIDEICVFTSSLKSSKDAFRKTGIVVESVSIEKDDTLVNEFKEVNVKEKNSYLKDVSDNLVYGIQSSSNSILSKSLTNLK